MFRAALCLYSGRQDCIITASGIFTLCTVRRLRADLFRSQPAYFTAVYRE